MLGPCWQKLFALNCLASDHSAICPATLSTVPAIRSHSLYRFEANQCRLLLHSAAYVLLETLRREVLRTTQGASATMATIQLRFLKLGARVQECKERITIALPSSCPVAPVLRRSLMLLACVRVNVPVL